MTEDEWYEIGKWRLKDWETYLENHGGRLSSNEGDAFLYAWEQAWEVHNDRLF